ncbi:class I SAM-dependent DNA methyltransferase [Desulfosporosinus sp. Sb-LF]|uniref:type I restriction-modification system subunit M n=1 Tax=Desulfosporosinus sp. Sb-LF TaxID=2560027 RepID=UPI00107F8EA6|nr:class I SAM-dependent DNA methyltransferase [Desulfosporosinus sp. Sb-LF]TGE31458.1 SAM-dependent DNA methyltransferase [Desulfosporosinus sp. Sb-LF]
MDDQVYNQIITFIWNIANDCLVHIYNKGDYRKIILPMIVIRRFDAVLEPTKKEVLEFKKQLDENDVLEQDDAICNIIGEAFCNSSPYTLKDLKARTRQQQLRADFSLYLDGFSKNVQEIIDKFKFRNEIDTLVDNDILGMLIEKFVDPQINLGSRPVYYDDGKTIKLPALDNHSMGTAFEHLLLRFNEENNVTEAGEHFTPRDIVELMADIAFIPVAHRITSTTYRIYDGACGTGGILTVADNRIHELAEAAEKKVSIHLYGQELQPETYAIARADMLIKGEGEQSEHIFYGSTISNDGFSRETYDFMISNPPFGTPWKKDLEAWGYKDKKEITDSRYIINYSGDPEYTIVPNVGDPQMLFLANNVSKMKKDTQLGSRIVEVHSGSSLFTGSIGGGESNLRRYIIENDWLEAIVALPEKLFYNTPIGTFLWIVTNKKPKERKGKVQLIDATSLKASLRKNLGEKNCEITYDIRRQIMDIYMAFDNANSEYSKVFDNIQFAYYSVDILRPLRLAVHLTDENFALFKKNVDDNPLYSVLVAVKEILYQESLLDYNDFITQVQVVATGKNVKMNTKREKLIRTYFTIVDEAAKKVYKKQYPNEEPNPLYGKFDPIAEGYASTVEFESDKDLKDNEIIPLSYEGGIDAFFKTEILPFTPDAWIDEDSTKIGYELSFTKYFYKPVQLRDLTDIIADIKGIEAETDGLLAEIIEVDL